MNIYRKREERNLIEKKIVYFLLFIYSLFKINNTKKYARKKIITIEV